MQSSSSGIEKSSNQRKFWNASIIFLILCGFFVGVTRTLDDPDLWGHLKYGLDTIASGHVLKVDPYSYLTTGQPWINHEWLAEVTMGLSWQAAGITGLLLLKALIWVVTFSVPFIYLATRPIPLLRAGILVLLCMPLAAPYYGTIRPHAYTALLYILVLLAIVQAERGKYGWLWICPPIFALWPNLHGAFPAGLGMLGVWGLAHLLLHRNKHTWLRVIPPLVLCVPVLLINPWGIELPRMILENLGDARLEITEWQPMQLSSLTGGIYLGWLLLSIVGIIYTRKPRHPALLILLAISAYVPLMAVRLTIFFCLTAIMIAGEHIASAWERWMPVRSSQKASPWVAGLVVLVSLFLILWRIPSLGNLPINTPTSYPIKIVALVEQSGISGNMAVHFNPSTYVIWHVSPEIKVSIDTRREMAYSQEVYALNMRHMLGIGSWADLLDKHPTDIAIVERFSATDNLMQLRPDWVLVYRDDRFNLFARRGSAQERQLQAALKDYEPPPGPYFFP